MHLLYDGGFLRGISGLGQAFVPRFSATRVADDVKEGGLGLGFSEPKSAATLGSLQLSLSSCGHPHPGFCAVLSSDCLCCFPSGAAASSSHSPLCNSPWAASLAFTAVWLELPSSFPKKASVWRGRCCGL